MERKGFIKVMAFMPVAATMNLSTLRHLSDELSKCSIFNDAIVAGSLNMLSVKIDKA